nr:subunit VI of cytochrome b6f complex [Dinophyceae sp. MRD-151]
MFTVISYLVLLIALLIATTVIYLTLLKVRLILLW